MHTYKPIYIYIHKYIRTLLGKVLKLRKKKMNKDRVEDLEEDDPGPISG